MAFVLQFIAYLFLAVSLAVWGSVFQRMRSGRAVVGYEPRRPAPWGGVEVVFAGCLFLLVGGSVGAVVGLATPAAANDAPQLLAAAQIIAGLVTTALIVLVVKLGCRATLVDLGWQRDQWLADLRLGILSYVAITPPVFLIQALLTQWIPYEHPVLTVLEGASLPTLFLLMTCLVVIVAPLAEELFFRVLLQGWLEDYGAATIVDIEPAVPLAAPRWPIVISAALFALMHLGQGPAPAPLFVLGLAMGYLYRQTHRITPPLVLHAFFNATSMLALALDSGSGPAG